MKTFITKHKLHWTNKSFLRSTASGVVLLLLSLVVNRVAGLYATKQMSNSVNDLILSNIRVFDVYDIFVYGAMIFFIFLVFLFLHEPRRIPFAFKSIALFVLIRSVFIVQTHLGPFPTHLSIDSHILNEFSPGGDFFFSAHTGLPFLMAFIYWEQTYLRFFFILLAIVFGIVVLLGHLHYSIDVLSAFFITYSIYHIAEILFKEDRKLFISGIR